MKNIILSSILFLFAIFTSLAQKGHPYGQLTNNEKTFNTYEEDKEAYAVVLYERGDNYFKVVKDRIRLIKEYHVKIKILDEKGFDHGTVAIPFYHNGTSTEIISGLKAMTHNGSQKIHVLPDNIYTKDITERRKETSFTFPDLQKGSIIEYEYQMISPYYFNFKGWEFQSDIPKLYSEFNAKIPGNYIYNRDLIGHLKLATNEATIQKECFRIDGMVQRADCEVLKYVMKDIPAFIEEEDYMLSRNNYISHLEFELSEYKRFNGTTDKYAKTWRDVDKEFRSDKDIGSQLTKKGFFEKNVPENLLTEPDELKKAKNIFAFIQNHYTWNGEYGLYTNNRVKKAFEEKKGNISEINMSLINLLNSANIKTNLMMLSTRGHGLAKTNHPVMSDFNYVVAKATINGKDYLLDATDNFNPFGMLPYKCLNYKGRVMDFKNESYWYDIIPSRNNKKIVRGKVTFDLENQKAIGIIDNLNTGYNAIFKRKDISTKTEEEYLEAIENQSSGDLYITSYEQIKEKSNKRKVFEKLGIEIEDVVDNDAIYFDPFIVKFFEKNPFLLEERHYPIDFGFKRTYVYSLRIEVPEGYMIDQLPEKVTKELSQNMGTLKFNTTLTDNNIIVQFNLSLNKTHYLTEYYQMLRDLFVDVTAVQNNSIIVLKKKS
ncbi:MAG: hypothetical protein COA50_07350 [Flavobacteriaceae bacterium]|nr:MAG: hypothetical protein COA50_07350 [Flavobacteriaceae bacterium]